MRVVYLYTIIIIIIIIIKKDKILPAVSELQGQVTKSVETVQQNTEGNVVIDYMNGYKAEFLNVSWRCTVFLLRRRMPADCSKGEVRWRRTLLYVLPVYWILQVL